MPEQQLLQRQVELQSRAQQVLHELDLLNLLGEYGDTKVVGSAALGLMTWPDIDIETYVEEYNVRHLTDIAYKLVTEHEAEVILRDYRNDPNPNKPKGLYLGIRHKYFGLKWKLDIWLLKPIHRQAYDITEHMTNLSETQRLSILAIKDKVWSHPRYRKDFASIDIYTAVLTHGISDISGFEQYLIETGRTLK